MIALQEKNWDTAISELGQASQQNPWPENETFSLVFSLAL